MTSEILLLEIMRLMLIDSTRELIFNERFDTIKLEEVHE